MDYLDRFTRQIAIPEIGIAGQKLLAKAHVAVIGAGGLGYPILMYLSAAGIGNITLFDCDTVAASNLNRQLFYQEEHIGKLKVEIAAEKIKAQFPYVNTTRHNDRLDEKNAAQLLGTPDLIIDAVDNLATRYIVNEYCVAHKIPAIYGAVESFSGQIFNRTSTSADAPCYECVFPNIGNYSPQKNIPIMGSTAGTLGCIQATQAIQYLCGHDMMKNTLRLVNLQRFQIRSIASKKRLNCKTCSKYC